MTKFSIRFSLILAISFLFLGCDKNDDLDLPSEDSVGVGVLSFGIVPISNTRNMEIGNSWDKQAECSNSQLKFVRIALKDSQGKCYYGNSDSGFFEMEMDPIGLDTNEDEIEDTWNTRGDKKLLLPVGNYTVEFFAVTNDTGKNSEIILMSPRRGDAGNSMQYSNYVKTSLPLQFTIREGMEHYIPLEALCFRKDLAFDFGFIFFNLEDTNPFYLCAQ